MNKGAVLTRRRLTSILTVDFPAPELREAHVCRYGHQSTASLSQHRKWAKTTARDTQKCDPAPVRAAGLVAEPQASQSPGARGLTEKTPSLAAIAAQAPEEVLVFLHGLPVSPPDTAVLGPGPVLTTSSPAHSCLQG